MPRATTTTGNSVFDQISTFLACTKVTKICKILSTVAEWMGRLIRMENRISNTVLDAKQDGKRKAGRPKLRWQDDVQADLKITGINGWRRKTQDRSE